MHLNCVLAIEGLMHLIACILSLKVIALLATNNVHFAVDNISVMSWRQLTLFMSFPGFTSTRPGL